ncbi:hypothetical protein [Streptomyces decoyicus]|uniref:hypothetical protein n=1 Tax=Streptomyces decoyicus TaxID=249567 RepID=UPI003657AF65
MHATNTVTTAVPAQLRMTDASETVRNLRERMQSAASMSDALRLLACELAGEFGLLEQFVSLMLTARERVEPYADFENEEGAEWNLWLALGLAAEDLQDRRSEITGPLVALDVMSMQDDRG